MNRPLLSTPRALFSHLTIRAKLLIAFVGLSVLPVLFVSVYGIYVNVRAMERIALENLTHDLNTTRGRASHFLTAVEGDVRVLLNSAAAGDYVRAVEHGTPRERDRQLNRFAEELLAFARTKGLYYQIRVIDANRDEVLRVESDTVRDSVSRYSLVPPEQLRQTGQSYYVLLTENLHPGEVAFSPVELLYRGTQRIPALSFAAPLYGPSGRDGILIANVFAGSLFSELEAQRNPGMNEKLVLVGSDGHYLYDSDERGDWNRMLASRQETNLRNEYSPPIALQIVSGSEGIISEGAGGIIAYAPLLPSRRAPAARDSSRLSVASLYIFESVPRGTITGAAQASATTFVGFLIVFFLCAIALGLLATRQFTRPISELRRGADFISRGNYDHRLEVQTGDEIEALAGTFNDMASSLEQRDREIQQHRTGLEGMVAHRTRELVEETARLQAILDNVPSAFVMLNADGRIRTASAAFSSITGLAPQEVIGEEAREVFRRHGLCRMADSEPAPGKTESHIDKILDRNGEEQLLEHVIIPIAEDGHARSTLQIITNITKRKRLEEHLIHSEKLMATGEMAAIIAHGFRNSLTSIKMILQLQEESKRPGNAAGKSLRVALDSIGRMETVVQELLTFARPTPMVFGKQDLNALVEESLALLAPRLKDRRITVRKTLDGRLPPLTVDAGRLREALVNVLLNAEQAIESRPARGGKIEIVTHQVALPRALRDYHSPEPLHGRERGQEGNGHEIILRKGTPCAVVTVTDNGPGIERGALRRIFDPFFTTKANGTGLGLPMVKRTVTAHGGVLSVRSVKGKGAAFAIVLPLKESTMA